MLTYISAHSTFFWVTILFLFLIFELLTGDFFLLCFSAGALIALCSGLLGCSFFCQFVLFLIFTLLSIFTLRPLAFKYLHHKSSPAASNVDAIIGRIGLIEEDSDAQGFGRMKLDGDSWKCKTSESIELKKGMKVKIISIDSVIATVEIID